MLRPEWIEKGKRAVAEACGCYGLDTGYECCNPTDCDCAKAATAALSAVLPGVVAGERERAAKVVAERDEARRLHGKLVLDASRQLNEAVDALRFYAEAWDRHPGDSGPGGNDPQEPECNPDMALLEDGGRRARAIIVDAGGDGGG